MCAVPDVSRTLDVRQFLALIFSEHSFSVAFIMLPPRIGGGIKWCFCLMFDVCLTSVAYSGHNSTTEMPRKTKIGTEVAHITRDSDTTFKVKGQGHQAALLSAALTRTAAAAVSVGTYSAWGKYCYIAFARWRARCLGAHGGGKGRGILCRHVHSLMILVMPPRA